MFYPVEALRRGGRFYVYWMADSWPQRFAEMSKRQLRATNMVQICQELEEVIATESGLPSCRFSLRLSSRLLHGLVIVHARKVNDMLFDMVMFHATIRRFKHYRNVSEPAKKRARPAIGAVTVREITAEEEAQMEAQAQANVVARIEDITLREEEIPERIVPIDGFGEETPQEQMRQLESMMRDSVIAPAHVSLDPEPAAAPADRTLRASLRLAVCEPSEVPDITDKDITNVEIPVPYIHVPDEILPAAALAVQPPAPPAPVATLQPEEMILEELEAPRGRARRRRRLVLDRMLVIESTVMIERMVDPKIHTEVSLADPRQDWTSAEALFRRPARGFREGRPAMSPNLLRLFTRNLAPVQRPQTVQAALDGALVPVVRRSKPRASSRIRPEPATPETAVAAQPDPLHHLTLPEELFAPQELTLPQDQTVMPMEISHRPTVGAENGSPELMSVEKGQAKEKRASTDETADVRRKRQKMSKLDVTLPAEEAAPPAPVADASPDATGWRPSLQDMLATAGLGERARATSRASGEDSAESPLLGSLDRTKVSLGESDVTTDSTKSIKEQWGPSGTILKIIGLIKSCERPVTVQTLLRSNPAPPGSGRLAAACCFTSILKLKQAGFLTIVKKPITLEIADIALGPKFK